MSILGQVGKVVGGIMVGGSSTSAADPLFRTTAQLGNNVWPNSLPGVNELLFAYRAGFLSAESVQRILKLAGVAFDPPTLRSGGIDFGKLNPLAEVWSKVYQSHEPQPALGELLTLVNRDQLDVREAHESLRRRGFTDAAMRTNLLRLRHEIPGPSDLVRFAVREVWDPQIVAKFGYDQEFPEQFDYWLGKQGLGQSALTPDEEARGVPDFSWAKAQWRAHWQNPSPTQGYEMMHRLRPTGGKDGGPRHPSGEVFTRSDLDSLLKTQDYASYWRPRLSAISDRVLGIRQLRSLERLGLYDRAKLVEAFQDMGYNRQDAETFADLTIRENRAAEFKTSVLGVKGKILRAYRLGVMDRDATARQLYYVGLVDPEKARDFKAKPEAEQTRIANDNPGVRLQLQTMDLERRMELAQAWLKTVRKLYLRGVLDRGDTLARLTALGIGAERRQELMDLWDAENDSSRKEVSTALVQRVYRHGIISQPEAEGRLINLGWTGEDAALLLAETNRDVALDQAKAAMAAARTQQQQQRAAQQRVAAARAEHNRARGELARHGTPAQLKRWYTRNLIDAGDVRRRLTLMDWPGDDIERLIAEADQDRQVNRSKAAKGQAVAGVEG